MKKIMADFETCTWLEDETYVWAWATVDIENQNDIKIGNDIEDFMKLCKKERNATFYFHNLKFDGSFIIYWLFKNGFKHVEEKEEIENNTFTTLINDMGVFYQICIYYKKGNKQVHKITFIDSLKIIPLSVAEIAKAYNLPISKLEIDYNKPRERGYILTKEEEEYIKNDVLIVAKALKLTFEQNLTKMTRASCALADYKDILNKEHMSFKHYFPVLDKEIDKDIRQAYKGGFTYLNPIYKEKDVLKPIVNLDVNSLYPSCMQDCLLPYGEPKYFDKKYENDIIYPLYVQMISCTFKIKKNKIPTIQLKNSMDFMPNQYIEDSGVMPVVLVLTNVDLELFFEHYDVDDLEYISGWKFKGIHGLFKDYIDKWITVKNTATIEKNGGLRTTAKLQLNSLYGKFAKTTEVRSKIPYLENDVIKYKFSEKKDVDGIYIPIGCFVTSYARDKTIRSAQKIKEYSINKYNEDKFIYSDTDSLKTTLSIEELEKILEIDNVKLGAWKNEGIASKGKWIRQKCYLEEIDGKMHITCSGLPKSCYDKVEWETFKTGFSCGGKLRFKNVKGGVKLVETEFTINEEKIRKNIKKF